MPLSTWTSTELHIEISSYECSLVSMQRNYEVSIASLPVISSSTTNFLTSSLVHAVVPLLNLYSRSFGGRTVLLSTCKLMFRSISVFSAVMMHASTLDPEPRSLKIPAETALKTRSRASRRCERLHEGSHAIKDNHWHTFMLGFHLLSKTAIAARLPEPIVTYGSLSVEPWGWMVKRWGPVESTPPRTSAAPTWPWYLKSICLSIVIAVTTLGFLPEERAWSSMLDEIRAVVNSVSAAVPAPQQRIDCVM